MGPDDLKTLLEAIQARDLSVADGLERLKHWPEADLGHTRLDTQRELRCGHPEVVFGAGKTPQQLVDISRSLLERHERLLVTRVSAEGAGALLESIADATHHEDARAVTVERGTERERVGRVLVVSAGTSDRPVAEEALVTARMLGADAEHVADVGVAGLHRLMSRAPQLAAARVLIVVAGMEGALPSVVGGLVDRPVIAVPTSVGYGTSFGGVTALLSMLNSCASGVTVVNIDNGFGAGYAAAQINRLHDESAT